MRRPFLTTAFAFAAAACSDAASEMLPFFEAPGPTAGTQLKPQFLESTNGEARRFLQLIDVKSGEGCAISRVVGEDGKFYCRPKASGQPVHLDARCSRRYVETEYGDHTWLGAGYGVVRLGARLDPQPAERYFEVAPGECAPMPQAAYAPIYEIAEEIPESELVFGELALDESDPRLSTHTFEGSDGSRTLYWIIDRVAEVGCLAKMTGEGLRCAPDTSTELHDEGMLDPNCDRLAILDYGAHGVATIPERGGDVYRFERPRDFGEISLGRRDQNGACMIEETHTGRKTLHFGVPYPVREWAPMMGHDTGDASLSARVAILSSGVRAEPEPSVDQRDMFEMNGAPCGPMWIGDSLHCVPSIREPQLWWVTAYADARCSEPLLAFREEGAIPVEATLYEGRGPRDGGHLYSGNVYAVGAELTENRVYSKDVLDRCQPATRPPTRYFRAGAAVPKERFPELRLVIE